MVDYYKERPIDSQFIKKLHKLAQRLLKKKDIYDEDELEQLYILETLHIHKTRLPANNIEAIFMNCKKGNFMVAYNIQSAVNYDTKLICAINITQNPTDHYELPNHKKSKRNINTTPKYISADAIYLNQISSLYLVDKKN